MAPPRVRFAPSPTGYLHIGGARSALFNWLWARKTGGTFVLRIEDTDQERSTRESVQAVIDSMLWLGLDWDEGPDPADLDKARGPHAPYFQMKRLALYRESYEKLIAGGHAYRCYCSKEELAAARAAHEKSGARQAFRYPGTCRARTDQPDKPFVVRFRSPTTGSTGWDDLIKGRIDVPNDAQQDFVMVRSDGVPLYNFGAVVDDVTMGITLVARGDDHVVNTPPQILLYQALGYPVPDLAHMPLILAPNGEKLSKRHAAVSVLEYRELGYLPDGVLNYLARLGWSHGDQEIFTRAELIEKFDWAQCGSTAGRYDAKKFTHVQASHLRMLTDDQIAAHTAPFLAARGLAIDGADPRLVSAIGTVHNRAQTFVECAEMVDFYFREPLVMDDAAKKKFLVPERASVLGELTELVRGVTPFTKAAIEERVTAWLAEKGHAMKEVAQPARVALTGKTQSPGLFEMMEALGKDKTLARLEHGAALAGGAAA